MATYNFLMIRIPRTASTSICQALNDYPRHKPASRLKEELKEEWDSLFKFSIVRHPYTRFISMYQHFFGDKVKFEEFMGKELYRGDSRFLPQVHYLYDQGRLIVDYLGRFEDLDSSWEFIAGKIGIGEMKLNHLKKSKPVKPELSEQHKRAIHQYYIRDFELLGYSSNKLY